MKLSSSQAGKDPSPAADPRVAALETIRQRFCAETEILDGAGIPAHCPSGDDLVASMLPDGSWADVDYRDDHLVNWAAARHLERLQSLARGWCRPGSPLHQRDHILDAVRRGLDGWYARDPQNPNWWWNQIGAPLLLADTLLCIKGACDRSYIERAIPAFVCHEPASRFTGANLVWVAGIEVRHGILADDPERASQGFILLGNEVRIVPDGEGIQPDMSFHQHGKLFYSGGYGQSFAADLGRLIAFAAGTAYAWPAPLVDRFAAYVLDGCRWMVRGRTFDPSAIGREITRQGHSAARFRAGLRHLAGFAHARQAEAQASSAIAPEAGRSLVTGNRLFWCSDFMVQHRPAYYLSVRTTSRRILNADWPCGGGEGRLCHHMAEGATFIMGDGNEYRDIYPVWNWRQIPGTTVVQDPGEFDPDAVRGVGERDFAGGASDGSVGCAAMDFSRAGLSVRKAWFLFDEGMVALGAGIRSSSPAPVRTTINQCIWRGPALLAGSDAPLAAGERRLAAGAAFWHDGVTYRLLDGEGTLRLGPQSGAWSDCGVGSPEPQTLAVMNAGLEHGCRPDGATYVYVVRPGVVAGAAFADDPARFVIVRNDPALQAVWHAGDRRGHAVFYEPGGIVFPDGQHIGVDRPCILLYQPQGVTSQLRDAPCRLVRQEAQISASGDVKSPGRQHSHTLVTGPLPHADGAVSLTIAQPEQRDGLITLCLEGRCRAMIGVSLPPREYAGSSQAVVWGP